MRGTYSLGIYSRRFFRWLLLSLLLLECLLELFKLAFGAFFLFSFSRLAAFDDAEELRLELLPLLLDRLERLVDRDEPDDDERDDDERELAVDGDRRLVGLDS